MQRYNSFAPPGSGDDPADSFREQLMMKYTAFSLVLLLLLSACADKPIVDMKSVDRAKYQVDLQECSTYADEVAVGKKAAGGAVAGAAVGAAIGAIWSGSSVGESAGTGAVLGGTRGTAEGVRDREQVVKQCLRGRGYPVLN